MAIVITDRFIREITSTWFDNYQWGCLGSGTTAFVGTENGLNSALQTGTTAANQNKVYDSGSTSFITSGSTGFVRLFKFNTLEPSTQPVAVGEIGLFKSLTGTTDMASMSLLNVTQTKDNTVQFNVRFQGKVKRI